MTHPLPSQSCNPWSFVPFALTIFTSAFLLFQVQPLLSKQILPWFGGSPAVWTTAMLFFQTLLCLGYLYAHALAALPSRKTQARIHVVLLVLAALLAARVLPGAELRPESPDSPVFQVLLILGASVGLPYFCLATTGPLVQHWFTSTAHASSVFRLYALSNVGSFLALLSFPYVLEPWLEQQEMGHLWTAGFWVFALLCLPVALGAWQNKTPAGAAHCDAAVGVVPVTPEGSASKPKPTLVQRLSWVALPALASLVFIATTDQISHDVAPEPRLWISTLGLYLVTFILTFDHPRWYRPRLFALLTLVLLLATSGLNDIPRWLGIDWDYGVNEVRWSHYALLFVVCMLCHGELYRRRPVDTGRLTEFYLCMSIGGAFGGLFVTLVATQFFDDYHEWLMALVLVALLACHVLFRLEGQSRGRVIQAVGALTAVVMVALLFAMQNPWSWREVRQDDRSEVLLDQIRNFYGTVSVKERRFVSEPKRDDRVFFSGNVTHGQQFLSDALRHVPTTYYARDSGIGETLKWAMDQKPSLSVALIGLGAGTLANYARQADAYDFYEINPAAVQFAQKWFDNLSSCKAGEQNILLGDARLRMEQLPKDKLYDVIVLDAFTGGSVPIHLLTREAFQIYRTHLKPDGHIAINITNAYLNLYPIVKAQAEVLGMAYRHKYQAVDEVRNVRRNLHFIMTHDQAYLKAYPSVNREVRDDQGRVLRSEPYDQPGLRLWTDQFSSIAPIVR
ncbi:MAG: fused MFS/spermidine synthase [Limnohabitans sp.]|jgi:spermidine synthase|uniref:spermidine synthase n=1 Tax=Limnohabitans sp. TaxID=1907725 RepID=UPI0025D4C2DC|nr:fused MFS/spermidine synthase [Limnohabitans sp.]MCO4087949.1 fused MFS/spermidine synthase [Limnohabitans sp.]